MENDFKQAFDKLLNEIFISFKIDKIVVKLNNLIEAVKRQLRRQ